MLDVDGAVYMTSAIEHLLFLYFKQLSACSLLIKWLNLFGTILQMKIVILMFLIIIGFELFLEGLWFKFPEEILNAVMVLTIIVALVHQHQRSQPNL